MEHKTLKGKRDECELIRYMVITGIASTSVFVKDQGLIVEKTNLDDIRKKIYHIVKDEWI